MRPLEITLSNHKPAVSSYTQMSNLKRIASYNHDYLKGWLKYNNRFYKNQKVVVQLLANLGIDPEWSLDFLVEYVELKKESIASVLNVVGIYQSGKTTHNTIYSPDYTELFVLLPQKNSVLDYIEEDESLILPIIPLFSNETMLDYVGPVLEGPAVKPSNDKLAVIGIDLMSLAINYWRFLRGNPTSNTGPHHWLAGIPLLNARIAAHRVAMLEVLYNSVLSEIKPSSIQQNDLAPVNDLTLQLDKYLDFTYQNLMKFGLYDEQDFLNKFVMWDSLTVDPLTLKGGKYLSYSSTQWVWNLPAMKIITIVNTVNRITGRTSDNAKTKAQAWLKQDYKGMVRNYCPSNIAGIYNSYLNDLIESVK